jgi:hypothetical protein
MTDQPGRRHGKKNEHMIDSDYERTMMVGNQSQISDSDSEEYDMIMAYVNYLKGGTRPWNYTEIVKLIINKLESLL